MSNRKTTESGKKKREEILQFIIAYMKEHGYAPSYSEIGEAVELCSKSSVYAHMKRMLKEGMIETDADDKAPRAIRVLGYEFRRKSNWIPVTERLPEEDELVLVQVSGTFEYITFENAYEFADYSKKEGWILEHYPEWKKPDIIAWQPLPEPYKEERTDEDDMQSMQKRDSVPGCSASPGARHGGLPAL